MKITYYGYVPGVFNYRGGTFRRQLRNSFPLKIIRFKSGALFSRLPEDILGPCCF